MTLPSASDIRKIADACRKAGVKHFKCADFELTLTDDAPVKKSRKAKAAQEQQAPQEDSVETDGLTQDQLLMWSSAGMLPEDSPPGAQS